MCPCGCGALLPLDEFDDVYIEDIPAVCRIVLRQRYQRARGAGCGTLFRHSEALAGPPVRTGDNLAITLTLLRAHGMTLRRLSDFYGGYNWLRTQRCWVHLLGDIREERDILPGSRQIEAFETAVLAAYVEGKRVQLFRQRHPRRRTPALPPALCPSDLPPQRHPTAGLAQAPGGQSSRHPAEPVRAYPDRLTRAHAYRPSDGFRPPEPGHPVTLANRAPPAGKPRA